MRENRDESRRFGALIVNIKAVTISVFDSGSYPGSSAFFNDDTHYTSVTHQLHIRHRYRNLQLTRDGYMFRFLLVSLLEPSSPEARPTLPLCWLKARLYGSLISISGSYASVVISRKRANSLL